MAEILVLETGEILPENEGSWVHFYRDGAEFMSRQNLSGGDLRVYLRLIHGIKPGNRCIINMSDMAQAIGMSRRVIMQSLARLEDLGVITRKSKSAGQIIYEMSRYFAYNRWQTGKPK